MLDKAKRRMMERAMANVTPSETEIGQALAEVIAGFEHQQAQAIQELIDAAGLDANVRHDVGAREQQLLDTADAVSEQRLPEFYLGQMGVDDVETAMQFLGTDDWPEQKRVWYDLYRERSVVEGPPVDNADQDDIDHAAQLHVREVFGVSLAQFEHAVVDWQRGAVIQQLLAGPIAGHTETIKHVAGEIEAEGDES